MCGVPVREWAVPEGICGPGSHCQPGRPILDSVCSAFCTPPTLATMKYKSGEDPSPRDRVREVWPGSKNANLVKGEDWSVYENPNKDSVSVCVRMCVWGAGGGVIHVCVRVCVCFWCSSKNRSCVEIIVDRCESSIFISPTSYPHTHTHTHTHWRTVFIFLNLRLLCYVPAACSSRPDRFSHADVLPTYLKSLLCVGTVCELLDH